jgi:signal transduction histidine kinase
MTFWGARIRLTFWYVLIVMVISLTFSVVVYRISSHEISVFNSRQSIILRGDPVLRGAPAPYRIEDFETARTQQLEDLRNHLIQNLALANIIILVLSAMSSYFLAKRTLSPIENMMELQNRFTADASHELRTPLAAMEVEIEVAMRDKDLSMADSRKLLKSNLEEIERLKELSNSLLELAQFQDLSKKIVAESFSLKETIELVITKVQKMADSKNIKIIASNQDVLVNTDKNDVMELVGIILDNAIKYSSEKKRIWVESTITKKNILITIKDEGIGIKKEDLPFIFNRFYQADTARSIDKGTGYGLGLAIAKQIVERHNGTIEVESNAAQGTIFKIKLPVKNSA